jgi:lactate dehydrogenase-like 2-hydroxyacid dehydrogenase
MPRILTPGTHSQETLAIAHDLLPTGYELVTAPHGRPEFLELLKDTEFYIGAGQFKHGPEFYRAAPKLKIVQTLSAGYNTYDLDAARAAGVPI